MAVAVTLLALVLVMSFAVSARHLASPLPLAYDPPESNEIPLLIDCLSNVRKVSYAADTGFFVLGGWFFIGWAGFTEADKRAAMSQASTTDFFLDGVLQGTSMWTRHAKTFTFLGVTFEDVKLKLIVWENHNGLSGTHVLTGRWYLDASFFGGSLGERVLDSTCERTVRFV